MLSSVKGYIERILGGQTKLEEKTPNKSIFLTNTSTEGFLANYPFP